MAPTGVAAINIEGTTINGNYLLSQTPKRRKMRLLSSKLKLLIIDEISRVSNITFLHIH